ncbi:malto-oligosyltrehalose trehalohydrolase [Spirosoma sp. KNUC1025]|uniref:malto-oligosyltrehalose trehalohydrolase n=1 Tax=Spirosoma sp. KNUC1025 TaxID=2894082 RepID=UPI00386FCBAC|nr:malto-oligosyltrehalose trehalohydrolase [Spirosoma sp. KNUC1025]
MKTIGANYIGNNRCVFTVWAPEKERVTLHLLPPNDRKLAMQPTEWGYFQLEVENIPPGTRYVYELDNGEEYPDPASHAQPDDVHGPSEVIDQSAYRWQDEGWRGLPFRDLIFYQLHVGTFTPAGTFEAIIPRLDALAKVGINALQLLPVCQFPGDRNWGYDGVYPYAVQHSYGGPQALKKLVNACHNRGIAVFLDVVFNHLGPEGNYFTQFGPYFTEKYQTPWGAALNFDQEWSDGVRDYFVDNVAFWFDTYHIDGLRFDAIHEIFDRGAVSIWELIHAKVRYLEQQLGRSLYLVAETDLNSPKVVKSSELGGYGFDAQWLDDFHHAFQVLINKSAKERYADFGRMEQLAKAYTDGFVSSGDYVTFRKRKYGASSSGIAGDRFVVFNLNHDQIGNQSGRERLALLVDFDRQKLAAAAILLSPYVPLLFMGEEYADESPFFYFISHSDPSLIRKVEEGHKKDFARFRSKADIPAPIEEDTFNQSKLQWHTRSRGNHRIMLSWYQSLIELRRSLPALQNMSKNNIRVTVLGQSGFVLHRQTVDGQQQLVCLFNLSDDVILYTLPVWVREWHKVLDSKEAKWREAGSSVRELLPSLAKAGQTIHIPPASVTVYSGTFLPNW